MRYGVVVCIIILLLLCLSSNAFAAGATTGTLSVSPAYINNSKIALIDYSIANSNGQNYMVYVHNGNNAIKVLSKGTAVNGAYQAYWDGRDGSETPITDGTYTITLNVTTPWTIIGSPGTGTGQFSYPYGVAFDGQGNIYVADDGNNRIQIWTAATNTWKTMGSPGTNPGQFHEPCGIAVDGQGNIYVADMFNNRIQTWEKATNTWTIMGSPGQFDQPTGVAVDSQGNIYVADSNNNRIQTWDKATNTWTIMGSPGQFSYPCGVAVDSQGNIYVADTINNMIQTWDKATNTWTTMGSPGTNPGQFRIPIGVAVDGQGNIYVDDCGNTRIQTWDKATNTWTTMGSYGTNPGQFQQPSGVALNGQGNIYVADTFNNRIQAFNLGSDLADSNVVVDNLAPGVTVGLSGTLVSGTLYNSDVQVTLTTTSSISGISSLTYSLNGMTETAYTAPFMVYAEGQNTVDYAVVDNAGNTRTGSRVFVIDKSAPQVAVSLYGDHVNSVWYDSNVTVAFNPTDAISGIGSFSYTVNGVNLGSYPYSLTVGNEGTNTVSYLATDNAGYSASGTTTFKIDRTAPNVSCNFTGSNPLTMSLTGSDALSGIQSLQYSGDNGTTWNTYTTPVAITVGAPMTVYYRAIDQAGNAAQGSAVLNLDKNGFTKIEYQTVTHTNTVYVTVTPVPVTPTPTTTPNKSVSPSPTVTISPVPSVSSTGTVSSATATPVPSPTDASGTGSGVSVYLLVLCSAIVGIVGLGAGLMLNRK